MTRRLPLVAWLTAVWVALWGEVSVANVASGLGIAAALAIAFHLPAAGAARGGTGGAVRPVRVVAFLTYFAWKLVEASAIVAWEVATPRKRIHEGIIAVPVRTTSDVLATVVANVVTLTPGTLTLELSRDPSVLYVHVLHLRSIEATRRDVARFEGLVVRAFGSADAVRDLDAADRSPDARPEEPR